MFNENDPMPIFASGKIHGKGVSNHNAVAVVFSCSWGVRNVPAIARHEDDFLVGCKPDVLDGFGVAGRPWGFCLEVKSIWVSVQYAVNDAFAHPL